MKDIKAIFHASLFLLVFTIVFALGLSLHGCTPVDIKTPSVFDRPEDGIYRVYIENTTQNFYSIAVWTDGETCSDGRPLCELLYETTLHPKMNYSSLERWIGEGKKLEDFEVPVDQTYHILKMDLKLGGYVIFIQKTLTNKPDQWKQFHKDLETDLRRGDGYIVVWTISDKTSNPINNIDFKF
jgi:hypothetical protein